MYKDKKFLAVIPARGGSKGIPRKNLAPVQGKPLIGYTIEAAVKSRYLDKIVVSTDSQEIAETAKELGAEVPFLRPAHLASDQAKSIDAVLHAINQLEEADESYDFIVLLQPTQPLRTSWHIDEAIAQVVDENLENLVGVSLVNEHPLLMRTVNEQNELVNLLSEGSTVRRQDFPDYYKVNGALYINKINEALNRETSLNDNRHPYVMDKKYDLDIDEPIDLALFELLLQNRVGEEA